MWQTAPTRQRTVTPLRHSWKGGEVETKPEKQRGTRAVRGGCSEDLGSRCPKDIRLSEKDQSQKCESAGLLRGVEHGLGTEQVKSGERRAIIMSTTSLCRKFRVVMCGHHVPSDVMQ